MRKQSVLRLILILGLVVLAVMIPLFSMIGVANISFFDSFKILISKIPFVGEYINLKNIDPIHGIIISNVRMPRVIMAMIVGIGLSVSGAAYQGMFKNPMADPYILGISSGAALGATIVIILGVHNTVIGFGAVSVSAFFGAALTAFLVYIIAVVRGKLPSLNLILAGIAISFLFSAIISFIMVFSVKDINRIIYWTMGSLSTSNWDKVIIATPIIFGGMLSIVNFSRELNIMSMGDSQAVSLGVDVSRVKKVILVMSSLIVSIIVSAVGIIGFVGLIIPHAVRLILGPDHKNIIIGSAIVGAIFMLICDTLARTLVPPAEIPVGVITSMFGAPFFIYLLIRNKLMN